ncbi:hypothetical protein GCM10022267_43140 [Lentzea roselyniae]|uniref:Uncharacterized protein n=1 Tax=Lentzea roselyniae TaxID=531940 RepID=A0ABP7B7T0_9PSEU
MNDELGGRLMVVHGDPVKIVPRSAKEIGSESVHVTADCAPYGANAMRLSRRRWGTSNSSAPARPAPSRRAVFAKRTAPRSRSSRRSATPDWTTAGASPRTPIRPLWTDQGALDPHTLEPVVDHAVERQVALDRYQAVRS